MKPRISPVLRPSARAARSAARAERRRDVSQRLADALDHHALGAVDRDRARCARACGVRGSRRDAAPLAHPVRRFAGIGVMHRPLCGGHGARALRAPRQRVLGRAASAPGRRDARRGCVALAARARCRGLRDVLHLARAPSLLVHRTRLGRHRCASDASNGRRGRRRASSRCTRRAPCSIGRRATGSRCR